MDCKDPWEVLKSLEACFRVNANLKGSSWRSSTDMSRSSHYSHQEYRVTLNETIETKARKTLLISVGTIFRT